jgi:hypothetical protein
MDLVYYVYTLSQTFLCYLYSILKKCLPVVFVVLFLFCFCFVVAIAFICIFCIFMPYSTSYCCHYKLTD